MNRLKDTIYDSILWLACLGFRKRSGQKKLLIVRVDEIGDYMLWRPFLKELISAEQYKGYGIHFYGNQSWKTVSLNFDSDTIHEIFWLDKLQFKKDMFYRYRLLKEIYRQQYDTVINPAFSRDKRYDDSIVKAAKAPHTLGMVANLESVRQYELGYDHTLYTRLFNHPQRPIFEFYRNKLFTEFVTGKPSSITDTKVDTPPPLFSHGLTRKIFCRIPRIKKQIAYLANGKFCTGKQLSF